MTHRTATNTLSTAIRVAFAALFLTAPVAAYAASQAAQQGDGMKGAGFVLYVTLQRNAIVR